MRNEIKTGRRVRKGKSIYVGVTDDVRGIKKWRARVGVQE